jgi:hypothetical protein
MSRANHFTLIGEVAYRHEADERLRGPGTAVLVNRGVPRSLVISCPDGCGDTLTINLDGRSGPAWRFYSNRKGPSLFPSVWRDNGCRSHFIIWQSRIYWCDWKDDVLVGSDSILEDQVSKALEPKFVSYVSIADQLGEVPWAVLVACNQLVSTGQAIEGKGADRGKFKRR